MNTAALRQSLSRAWPTFAAVAVVLAALQIEWLDGPARTPALLAVGAAWIAGQALLAWHAMRSRPARDGEAIGIVRQVLWFQAGSFALAGCGGDALRWFAVAAAPLVLLNGAIFVALPRVLVLLALNAGLFAVALLGWAVVAPDAFVPAHESARAIVMAALSLAVFMIAQESSRLREALLRGGERMAAQFEQLRERSLIDEQTGIHNRRALNEWLLQQKGLADRHGHRFVIAVLRLERFGRVGDVFGRGVADDVARKVARGLRDVVREVDSVARIGPGTFAAVLAGTDADGAELALSRMHRLLEAMEISPLMPHFRVTARTAAIAYQAGDEAGDLLRRAESAVAPAVAMA